MCLMQKALYLIRAVYRTSSREMTSHSISWRRKLWIKHLRTREKSYIQIRQVTQWLEWITSQRCNQRPLIGIVILYRKGGLWLTETRSLRSHLALRKELAMPCTVLSQNWKRSFSKSLETHRPEHNSMRWSDSFRPWKLRQFQLNGLPKRHDFWTKSLTRKSGIWA